MEREKNSYLHKLFSQQPQHGGPAIQDIKLYYHAAILLAIMQWWKKSNYLSWHMERMCETSLSEAALSLDQKQLKIQALNAKTLRDVWRRYMKALVTPISLLSSFILQPDFQQAHLNSSFENWMQAGLCRFGDISKNGVLLPQETALEKIGNSLLCSFQYTQVCDGQHHSNAVYL